MTAEDLTDWLETTIDDSFDLGWTSRDAAKLIVSRMNQEGLVLAPVHPAADLVEALEAELAWHEDEAKALSKQPPSPGLEWPKHQHRERIEALRAALSRYAKGGA